MKKLILLLIAVIVLGTLVVTCPDKEAHMTALSNELTSYLDANRMSEDSLKQNDDAIMKGLSLMMYSVAGSIVKSVLENQLVLDNNFIYSTGKLNTEEGSKIVSVGLLGHVFVFLDADKIEENLK